MKIAIIHPWSRTLRSGKENAKNFPYWSEVIEALHKKNIHTIQLGLEGEKLIGTKETFLSKSLGEVKNLLDKCNTWCSIDSFLPHLNNIHNKKSGVVIFGQSDPRIFGYPENVNLLKDFKYLRKQQYATWEEAVFNKECFVDSKKVVEAICYLLNKK